MCGPRLNLAIVESLSGLARKADDINGAFLSELTLAELQGEPFLLMGPKARWLHKKLHPDFI